MDWHNKFLLNEKNNDIKKLPDGDLDENVMGPIHGGVFELYTKDSCLMRGTATTSRGWSDEDLDRDALGPIDGDEVLGTSQRVLVQ